jgi:hypothetical protein
MIVNELDRCDMGGPFLIEDLRLITSQSCWSLGPREPATLTLPCLVSPLYLQGPFGPPIHVCSAELSSACAGHLVLAKARPMSSSGFTGSISGDAYHREAKC